MGRPGFERSAGGARVVAQDARRGHDQVRVFGRGAAVICGCQRYRLVGAKVQAGQGLGIVELDAVRAVGRFAAGEREDIGPGFRDWLREYVDGGGG